MTDGEKATTDARARLHEQPGDPFRAQAVAIYRELLPVAESLLNQVARRHGLGATVQLPACRLVIRDLGRAAGRAMTGSIVINQQLVDHPGSLRPTLAHELAHVVVERARRVLQIRHRDGIWSAHGANWRRVAVALGDDGHRCHELDLKPRRTVCRYLYRLPDGTERHLSAIRHHRLQKNRRSSYQWRGDAEPVRWFHLVGKLTE